MVICGVKKYYENVQYIQKNLNANIKFNILWESQPWTHLKTMHTVYLELRYCKIDPDLIDYKVQAHACTVQYGELRKSGSTLTKETGL